MKKIILVIMLLLLTGCYDYKELNQIAIVGATSIDKKDDNYIVKIQVINPQNVKEATSNNNTSFVV
jgi:spore germination protein KC